MPVLEVHVNGDSSEQTESPSSRCHHSHKKVSFSPRPDSYGLTYSKFEYDRSPILVQKRGINTQSSDGAWADAFLSMGSMCM